MARLTHIFLFILAAIAALLYCSWPLGYILNPAVAKHGLASELAGAQQPYNWVFVWSDVVSSLMLLGAITLLLITSQTQQLQRWVKLSLLALALFCLATSIAALAQVPCVSALRSCPNFTRNPVTLTHGIASVAAGVALFISLVSLWWHRRSWRLGLLNLSYMIIGLLAVAMLFVPGQQVGVQNTYITVSALCLLIYPVCYKHAITTPH